MAKSPISRLTYWTFLVVLPLVISGIPTAYMIVDRIKAQGAQEERDRERDDEIAQLKQRQRYHFGPVHLDPASTQPTGLP